MLARLLSEIQLGLGFGPPFSRDWHLSRLSRGCWLGNYGFSGDAVDRLHQVLLGAQAARNKHRWRNCRNADNENMRQRKSEVRFHIMGLLAIQFLLNGSDVGGF